MSFKFAVLHVETSDYVVSEVLVEFFVTAKFNVQVSGLRCVLNSVVWFGCDGCDAVV